jgi:hypothetical protein
MTTHGLIRDLLHAKLELQDDQALEQFWFIDERHVAATIGTKGGAICGPVLFYRIAGDEAVEIHDNSGKVWFRWEKIEVKGAVLAVLCEDKLKEFSIDSSPARASG